MTSTWLPVSEIYFIMLCTHITVIILSAIKRSATTAAFIATLPLIFMGFWLNLKPFECFFRF